jgi:hypothetical protein
MVYVYIKIEILFSGNFDRKTNPLEFISLKNDFVDPV